MQSCAGVQTRAKTRALRTMRFARMTPVQLALASFALLVEQLTISLEVLVESLTQLPNTVCFGLTTCAIHERPFT